MQTKCRFYTRERRTLRYRAVPSKRGHQKALQICVSFESCDAQNSQESDRMTAGEWGEGIRVENINYSIIMCDAQWEKEGRRRGRDRGGSASVSAAVGELCMTAMIDLWKEHTPKGYWKALNSWHQQTLRHWKGEERRRRRSRWSRRIQSKGKFFSFVIV